MAEGSPQGLVNGLIRIGKHFQLVSVLPAAAIVLTTFGLMTSGAPANAPSAGRVVEQASQLGGVGIAGLVVAVLIVGMTLDPFQFAATQALEGYWGSSQLGRSAMFSRARIHLDRQLYYLGERGLAKRRADRLREEQPVDDVALRAKEYALLEAAIDYQAFDSAVARYPMERSRIMPTRLGNMLRRLEDLAGKPYGINHAIPVVPHLLALASESPEVQAVNDARSELDLAIRWVVSWLLVAVITFVLLVPQGAWVVLSLAAYGLAWVSYRGSVHAAADYGYALWVVVDLNLGSAENRCTPLNAGIESRRAWVAAIARRDH